MTTVSRRLLYWTPRVTGVLFAAFLSIFALDVFGEGLGFWRTLAALGLHLVPVFCLLLILAVAWRWEWVGTVFLTLLGCLYLRLAGQRHLDWRSYVMIGGPLFLLAGLFLANWVKRAELRQH